MFENKDRIKADKVNTLYKPALMQTEERKEQPDSSVVDDRLLGILSNEQGEKDEEYDGKDDAGTPSSNRSTARSSPSTSVRSTPASAKSHTKPVSHPRVKPMESSISKPVSAPRVHSSSSSSSNAKPAAPSLSDVLKKQMTSHASISSFTVNNEAKKRELMFKWEMLKRHSGDYPIPEFSFYSDYEEMQRTYDETVKHISIDSTIKQYNQYLVVAFAVTQFVFTRVFKLNMEGYFFAQIAGLDKYKSLLIELGEKSYVPTGSSWPVEIRLIGAVLINSFLFVGARLVPEALAYFSTGSSASHTPQPSTSSTTQQAPSTKMKGPDMDF